MCKITNKCLFVSGFGMQMLVYYCASAGFSTELHVINGNEKGGPLSTIKDVPPKLMQVNLAGDRAQPVFLDNLTGDYYYYEEKSNEWKPRGNVGLHYSRAMSSLGGGVGGDLVKKVSVYQSKAASDLKPTLFFSKLTDVKCTVKKQCIGHPLMEGLPQEFVVDNRNTWDSHPINITNMQLIEKLYDMLAESDRGPQVATHQNTLVVQFQVEAKYLETVRILANYV